MTNATELIYFRKLLAGIETIKTESLTNLQSLERLEEIISGIGLAYDGRGLYGSSNQHMNFLGPGLWQIPRQLAQALCLLSSLRVRTAVEIGTYQGWTASVLAPYLQRFDKDFHLTTVDPMNYFTSYRRVRDRIPITYLVGQTSDDLRGSEFDLCFIDGDHSYEACSRDYDLIGRNSRVCMFHDINDKFVGDETVPRFWAELKRAEQDTATFYEFCYHSEGARVMGIGIRVRKDTP